MDELKQQLTTLLGTDGFYILTDLLTEVCRTRADLMLARFDDQETADIWELRAQRFEEME